jgi:hypothetical protein
MDVWKQSVAIWSGFMWLRMERSGEVPLTSVQIWYSVRCSETRSDCILPIPWNTKFHTHTNQLHGTVPSWDSFEELRVSYPVEIFSAFSWCQRCITLSIRSATDPYLKSDETSLLPPTFPLRSLVILCSHIRLGGSRNSVVGTATGYGLDERGVGVRVPVGSRICSSPRRQDRLWDPPNLLSNGYRRALSSGVKRLGRETDHSPPTSAEAKKIWIYTSIFPYTFMA